MVELREYQKGIVNVETERDNVMIVAPMGAGKTLATLVALMGIVYREGIKNVLLIAPKRVATSVWEQEAKKFDLPLNIRYCVRGLDVKEFLLDGASHHVAVCSVTRIGEIPHGCWDAGIIDESTLFGNASSLRSKEIRRIFSATVTSKLRKHPAYFPVDGCYVRKRIELTGTPIHGGYEKLFHQCLLLDGGKALGKTLTEFRQRYMMVKYQMAGAYTVWEINPAMVPQLMRDCKHLIYVVKEHVKLPPLLPKVIEIELPSKRMQEYREFENASILKFIAEQGGMEPRFERFKGMFGGQDYLAKYDTTRKEYLTLAGDINTTAKALDAETRKTLIAFASSSRGMKLRQLASGCVYTDEERKTYSITHRLKIEALKEVIEAINRGVLVAYQFKSEYDELKKAFPEARRLDTAKDIDDWNAGRIPIALVHPASVGHGLNLQYGGNVAVWYSLTYDAEQFAQLNKRLHRPGQADPVSLLFFVAKGTIDERILKVVQTKELNAYNFTNG